MLVATKNDNGVVGLSVLRYIFNGILSIRKEFAAHQTHQIQVQFIDAWHEII